jgi:tetratricopeptide (TPR) repeat protein
MMRGQGGNSAPSDDVREPVVIVPFEVQATDAELANLGRQAADRISAAITAAGLGAVVPYRAAAGSGNAPFSPALGARVVSETGAATLVTGVIYQRGDSVEVRAQVLRASDLKPLFSLPAERGGATSPEAPLEATTQRVLGAVGRYLSPAARAFDVTLYHPPSNLEAFRLFDKASELFRQTFGDSATQALLLEAFRLDTTLYMAAIDLAASYANYGDLRRSDSILTELEARRSRLAVGEALFLDAHQSRRRSPEEEYRASIALFQAGSGWTFDAMMSSVRANRPEEALRYWARRDTSTVWVREWQAWDFWAARAFHALGRFTEEVALARAARDREPRARGHWEREARALAALGRTEELEQLINASYNLEDPLAPGYLMGRAAQELQDHGYPESAQTLFARALAWVETLPPESQLDADMRNLARNALRGLGRYDEVRRRYALEGRDPRTGLGLRALGMRDAIRSGDTTGALAMVDSLRSASTDVLRAVWPGSPEGDRTYYGAQILALLGRRDEAVAWLRQALNAGRRLEPDEALQWYWEPIRDYPPFQELVRVKG